MTSADLIARSDDGTRVEPFEAELPVLGGPLAQFGRVTASAPEEIDATGCIITPGFIELPAFPGRLVRRALQTSQEVGA